MEESYKAVRNASRRLQLFLDNLPNDYRFPPHKSIVLPEKWIPDTVGGDVNMKNDFFVPISSDDIRDLSCHQDPILIEQNISTEGRPKRTKTAFTPKDEWLQSQPALDCKKGERNQQWDLFRKRAELLAAKNVTRTIMSVNTDNDIDRKIIEGIEEAYNKSEIPRIYYLIDESCYLN